MSERDRTAKPDQGPPDDEHAHIVCGHIAHSARSRELAATIGEARIQ